jgi:hypothetical protein
MRIGIGARLSGASADGALNLLVLVLRGFGFLFVAIIIPRAGSRSLSRSGPCGNRLQCPTTREGKSPSPELCRFYGARGEEIISIGADVTERRSPPCHGSESRMTLADP